MFWIFVRITTGDSNKYPKHICSMRGNENKKDLSYISICSFSVLYNSKFVLMAMSLGANAVIVTRVHCTCLLPAPQIAF